jgi:predicted glycoside hydrolase/deacetylase ChbG (UPF0249 family)
VLNLVVTADDLGIDPRRDDGIFEAFEHGVITHTSLLVGGPSSASAAERARRDGWPVGLHLNLTEGTPAAKASDVATLLDASGQKLGKHGLRDAASRGEVSLAHVARETEAQIARFEALMGHGPRHIDGHQHVHVIPELVETLATVFADQNVGSTRIPEQRVVHGDTSAAHRFYENVSREAAVARAIYARQGIASTEAFVGLDVMGIESSGARLRDAVRAVSSLSSAEVMCHPGHVGTGWDDFNQSPDREHELGVLLARPFAALVELRAVKLARFADLAESSALWCPR